jgi:hypothetical protein
VSRLSPSKSLSPAPSSFWIAVGLGAALALMTVAGARDALAAGRGPSHVKEVCRTLADDANFKVRVQAALVLGKLGDPAGGPCLQGALSDQNRAVRAMAAQALGQLGDPGNLEVLRGLAKRDADPFVRTQADKAIAMLSSHPQAGSGVGVGGGGRPKIFLNFGPFTGGVKAAAGEAVRIVHDTLEAELGKLSIVTLTAIPGGRPGPAFWIDGNVNRLDDVAAGSLTEISCGVKVMVATWPSKKIISWTSAEASVQAGSRQRDRDNARKDCLEATANQLAEDLAKFLKAQGG